MNIIDIKPQFKLHKINLTFNSIDFENEFRKGYLKKSLPIFRAAFITVTLLYVSYSFFDKLVSPEYYNDFLIVRFAIVFPLLLGVFIFSYSRLFQKIWQSILMLCFIVTGTGIIYMIAKIPDNLFYYGGLFLVFLAGFFFIRLRFFSAFISSILLLIIYNIFAVSIGFNNDMDINNVFLSNSFYMSTILIASFASYYIEKLERKEFYQQQMLLLQQKQINKMNRNLEQKVIDRTKEIEKAKEKAEESNRLKTAFLNNISHEFRTPMSGILGFTDLFIKPNRTEEQRKKYKEMIHDSCERLLDVVTDTIEVSEIQSKVAKLKLEKCSINEIIDELHKIIKPKIEKRGLTFKYINKCSAKEILINSDRQKIFRSLKHLLDNAIKFTNKGFVELKCIKKQDTIQLTIKDTGIGISPEIQELMFEPFRQAELGLGRNFGGNGIGLTLVKSYIEMIGGQIKLQSEINKGTTITLIIPVEYGQSLQTKSNEKPVNDVNWKDKTILIVDDEAINFKYLREILLEKEAKTIYAKNGQEAVDFCRNNADIDLILMDIKMPIMNGYEATKLIKAFRGDIPVIAQTAYNMDADKDKIKESGFDDVLIKPIDEEDLINKIQYYQRGCRFKRRSR